MKTRETEVKVEKNEATVPTFWFVVFVVKSIIRGWELRYEASLESV